MVCEDGVGSLDWVMVCTEPLELLSSLVRYFGLLGNLSHLAISNGGRRFETFELVNIFVIV